MVYNPFANVRISGTWEDHASYSKGGTDLPLGYATPLPAPAPGILRTSGGNGEWAAGWIGSAGRRSILSLTTPISRHSPQRSTPYEAYGPMTAIVFQHQAEFASEGWKNEGWTCGWSGASANGSNFGGDIHLHWHGLDANGNRLRIESFLPASSTAGGGTTPIEEYGDPDVVMVIRHDGSGRTFGIAPGFLKHHADLAQYSQAIRQSRQSSALNCDDADFKRMLWNNGLEEYSQDPWYAEMVAGTTPGKLWIAGWNKS